MELGTQDVGLIFYMGAVCLGCVNLGQREEGGVRSTVTRMKKVSVNEDVEGC